MKWSDLIKTIFQGIPRLDVQDQSYLPIPDTFFALSKRWKATKGKIEMAFHRVNSCQFHAHGRFFYVCRPDGGHHIGKTFHL